VDLRAGRLDARRSLLGTIDRSLAQLAGNERFLARDRFTEQALALIGSSRLRQATDLDREPERVRERYGQHLFGQGLLLSRRLLEAGAPLVTVYWIDPTPPGEGGGEFDSHGRIYHHMRNRLLPPADRALAALVGDLSSRGLLDDTLLVVMSEFGRTPRINRDAGRDHWPQVQTVLLAGAGIGGGSIFGATDRIAAYPREDPITPQDLGQTILHMLGVPADFEIHDRQGRPLLASTGNVVERLIQT